MKIGNVEYGGQRQHQITYTVAAGAVEGDAVTLTAAGTVGRGADGGAYLGKLIKIEPDGKGTVICTGIINQAAVAGETFGYKGLVVDGAGKVKAGAANAGRQALVIGVVDDMAIIDLL